MRIKALTKIEIHHISVSLIKIILIKKVIDICLKRYIMKSNGHMSIIN